MIEINLNPPENQHYNSVEASFYDIGLYIFFQNVNAKLEADSQLIVFAMKERDAERLRRQKRQLNRENCFDISTNYFIRSLIINFKEDLNWDWTLTPAEFDTDYCSGNCPYLWPSALFNILIVDEEPCCIAQNIFIYFIMYRPQS